MKKRILSLLLCLCMAATFLPTAALAAAGGGSIKICGIDMEDGKYYAVKDGVLTAEETQPDGSYLEYNAGTLTVHGAVELPAVSSWPTLNVTAGTLTITGGEDDALTVTAGGPPAINCIDPGSVQLDGDMNFTLNAGAGSAPSNPFTTTQNYSGDITMTGASSAPIIAGNVDIQSAGNISITNNNSNGLAVVGKLTIHNAEKVTVSSAGTSPAITAGADISAAGDVTITSSSGEAVGGGLTIQNAGKVTVSGAGTSPAIVGDTDISTAGDVSITSSGYSAVSGKLTIQNAKNVTVSGAGDSPAIGGADIKAEGDVSITSSSYIAVSGKLTIQNAENVTVSSADDRPTIINGADITASGKVSIKNTGGGTSSLAVNGDLIIKDAAEVEIFSNASNSSAIYGNADITSQGDVTLTSSKHHVITIGGDEPASLTIESGGDVTISSGLTDGAAANLGTVSITADGNISITDPSETDYSQAELTSKNGAAGVNKTIVTITGVSVTGRAYNGEAISRTGVPAFTTRDGEAVTGLEADYTWSTTDGSAPVSAGDYELELTVSEDDYIGRTKIAFTISKAAVTITAENKSAEAGSERPELTCTVSGLARGESLKTEPTLTCDADMDTAGSYSITASGASVPDGDNYEPEITYVAGTLTVTAKPSSGDDTPETPPSGDTPVTPPSGSAPVILPPPSDEGSPSGTAAPTTTITTNPDGSTTTRTENKATGTVTETTRNPDGSQTVVEIRKDGTVTITETDKAGNRTETTTNPDGSSATTVTRKDGTAATVTTDAGGRTEAAVKLSAQAVSAAQSSGEAAALPIPAVRATRDRGTAPVVTVRTGSSQPVKVEIPTANVTPGTVAVIVKADGTEAVIRTSVPTGNGVAVSLSDGATVKIVDNGKQFADVPANNWAADAVRFITARELFSGTSETAFSPDVPMTRAMLMTVLARFDGADTSGGDTWYTKGMDWAAARGISDGSNPSGSVTREQLAVMLWRYAGSPASGGALSGFADAASVSGYAQEAMNWAVESGIIGGFGNGQLGPQGQVTRAQVAAMLMRYVKN